MRIILFDIDGTLIDGRGMGRKALEHAFAEVFELESVPSVEGRVQFNGALDPAIHRAMAALLGITPHQLSDRRAALEARYMAHLQVFSRKGPGARMLPGVAPLLRALGDLPGVALGLATGNIEPGARMKLEPHGLNGYFATGGFGDDGPTRTAMVAWARRRVEAQAGLEVRPDQVIMVGDAVEDVTAARENGFSSLAVETGWTARSRLEEAGPDRLLPSLANLAEVLGVMGLEAAAGPLHG